MNKGPIEIPKEAEETISNFFKQEYIVVVQVTRTIAEQARALIWRFTHLRPKDALHAATALYAEIENLHTFDADFLPLDGQIGSPVLRVREPHMAQPDLPLEPLPDEDDQEEGEKSDEVN